MRSQESVILKWLIKKVHLDSRGNIGRKVIGGGQPMTFEGATPMDQICSFVEAAHAEVLARKSDGHSGGMTTVAEHLDYFVDEILPHENMKEQTRRTRRNECAQLRETLGDKTPHLLTQSDINMHCKARGCRGATMKNEINTLQRAIVRTRENLDLDPINIKFKIPKADKPARKTFEEDDLDRIYAGLEAVEPRYANLARLAYASGQRIEVVLGARWSHVVVQNGTKYIDFDLAKEVQGGTKDGATLPIEGKIADFLNPMMPDTPSNDLICGVGDEERRQIDRVFTKVLVGLGLREDKKRKTGEAKQRLWHTFRGSRVTHMLLKGESVPVVAALTSNDLATVQSYYAALASKKDLRDALNRESRAA